MDKDDVIGIIALFIIAIAIFIIGSVLIEDTDTQENIDIYEVQQCEHEWVVSSKYDLLFKSYKTISKCAKCGKEV